MPDSEAKKKWIKENTTTMSLRLNHNTDADIIKWLNNMPNRQGYIKSAIRRDIARQNEG